MKNNKIKEDVDKTVEKIKELVKKGNVSKIVIKHKDNIFLNIPLNAGIAGTILGLAAAPWALIATTIATIGFKCQIEIIKDNGDVIEVIDTQE